MIGADITIPISDNLNPIRSLTKAFRKAGYHKITVNAAISPERMEELKKTPYVFSFDSKNYWFTPMSWLRPIDSDGICSIPYPRFHLLVSRVKKLQDGKQYFLRLHIHIHLDKSPHRADKRFIGVRLCMEEIERLQSLFPYR
jgi:hypothetical protein